MRSERALKLAIAEMYTRRYLQGLDIVEILCGTGQLCPSQQAGKGA